MLRVVHDTRGLRPSALPVSLGLACSFGLAGLLCVAAPAAAQDHHGAHASGIPHAIPDFCAAPTMTAAASGNWSNPATWSGNRTPRTADVIVIGGGRNITYDVSNASPLAAVCVDGELVFRTDMSTKLVVGTLYVRETGGLEVGNQLAPVNVGVTAEIVIANQPLNTGVDPEQFGTGLLGTGRVTMHGAIKQPTFVRLTAERSAGQNTLPIAAGVSGWQAGDKLIVPDSKQWGIESYPYTEEWEEPTLSSASGNTLTLSGGLQFNHPGARNGNGVLEFYPHVGNLSRNVIVRSEDPSGTRGHVLFNNRANVDIRYALFKDLGRTTIAFLNNTQYSGSTPTSIGTNQMGRYSLHMHHVFGPVTTPANGYQYTLIGNAIDNGTKWGITVHNSHYGLVKDNVIYNAAGAGVMTEDGSESFNVIETNFVVRSRGTGEERGDSRGGGMGGIDFGYEGSAYWIRGTNNYVRDNVAANSNSFAYAVFPLNLSSVRIPKFKGADTSVDGNYNLSNGQAMPLLEFARNEVYGSVSGLTFWDVGADCCTAVNEVAESLVKDFHAWHLSRYGYYGYGQNRVTFDGWVQRNDKAILANNYENNLGLWFGDYITRNLIIKNTDIQGARVGIRAPFKPGDMNDIYGNQPGTTRIENTYLRNHYNIAISPMYGVTGGGGSLPPRRIFIDNVRYDPVSGNVGGNPQFNIAMSYNVDDRNANVIQMDQVFVTNYNGVAGANYQVFYTQQAPSFVVPASTSQLVGAPVSGLTNLQTWAQYGIAIAGAVAPCQTQVVGIEGFACSGTFNPPARVTNLRIVSSQD